MSLIISSTGARQLPAEFVNNSRVKFVGAPTSPQSPLAGVVGEKAVLRGDTDRVLKDARQAIQDGKARPIHFDSVEISEEARAATSAKKTSSIFDQKIEWMEGESWKDFEARLKEDFAAKCSEYYTKFNSGTLTEEERLPDAIEAATFLPEAVRREGQSDEDFAKEKLFRDTWNTWTAQWIKVSTAAMNMPMGESLRYQNEQHAAWAADLMENDPAMFREYLDLMVKPQVDHGNFGVAHVPPGFTIADYNEWMSKDISEYL